MTSSEGEMILKVATICQMTVLLCSIDNFNSFLLFQNSLKKDFNRLYFYRNKTIIYPNHTILTFLMTCFLNISTYILFGS